MIKAIIFDLNGVFIQSELLSDRFAKNFNVTPEEFMPALKEIMAQVREPGAKPLYSHWQPYLNQWRVKLSESEFIDYWFRAEHQVQEMVNLAEQLKNNGLKIFILSNNLRERSAYYFEHFPFIKTLPEKLYFSWQTGFIKPDTRAYLLILEENNLMPDECLYFDDSNKNVKAANSLGIQSFKFEGIEKLRNQLKNLKLLAE